MQRNRHPQHHKLSARVAHHSTDFSPGLRLASNRSHRTSMCRNFVKSTHCHKRQVPCKAHEWLAYKTVILLLSCWSNVWPHVLETQLPTQPPLTHNVHDHPIEAVGRETIPCVGC